MVYLRTEKLKVAIVGLGKMGILHASILNTLPTVELVALCDKSALIRKVCKKLFKGLQVEADLEMFSDLGLDIIYVTTPILSHFAVTQSIYTQKIAPNVFIEKPLSKNLAESSELCQLAASSDGLNMVGYMKRFAVTFRKAKDLLDNHVLGDLTSFDAYAYSSDFFGTDPNSKAGNARGGVLSDLGAHVIDLSFWFFNSLDVDLSKSEQSIDSNSDDPMLFTVKSSAGLEGEFSISWFKPNYRMPEFGLKINGSKGTMSVNDDQVHLKLENKKAVTWYRHDLKDNVGFQLGGPEYYREDEYFVKSVLEKCNVIPDFHDAFKVDSIIDSVKIGDEIND